MVYATLHVTCIMLKVHIIIGNLDKIAEAQIKLGLLNFHLLIKLIELFMEKLGFFLVFSF